MIAGLDWKGPAYVISAATGEGTRSLAKDVMSYLESADSGEE